MRAPTALLLCLVSLVGAAEPWTARPLGSTAAPYGYLEFVPPTVAKAGAKAKRVPLVLFLHGKGELGDSSSELPQVAKHGPLRHIAAQDAIGKALVGTSAIIIAPQGLRADNWWQTGKLVQLLDVILETYPVDLDRVYVTGLSMGGGGTWALAGAAGDRIAAIAPICGAGKPGQQLAHLDRMPIWAFHAIGDTVVNFPDHTQAWLTALLQRREALPAAGVMAGRSADTAPWTGTLLGTTWSWRTGETPQGGPAAAKLLVTVFPDGSHDSWSRAYRNPAFWTWLFAQRRG